MTRTVDVGEPSVVPASYILVLHEEGQRGARRSSLIDPREDAHVVGLLTGRSEATFAPPSTGER